MTDDIRVGELTLERMRADVAALIHEAADDIELDDNLAELGLDSMRAMSLLASWSELGLRCNFSDLASAEPTLQGWWDFFARGGHG